MEVWLEKCKEALHSTEGPTKAIAHESTVVLIYALWAFSLKTFRSPGYGMRKAHRETEMDWKTLISLQGTYFVLSDKLGREMGQCLGA